MNNQTQTQFINPNIRLLGYATWFVMAVLSIIYFKERATFMDGGFQLFDLINKESVSVHHYRLTNPLTQLLPLFAVKLKLSLKSVMILYSFNFILFQSLLYLLIVKWCKNDFLGLVQIGFFTMMVTESFYFLTPEFYQGMSVLLLWFAMLMKFSFHKQKWLFPLLAILIIPILFDHALLAIFFGFSWIFFWLHFPTLRNKYYYGLFAIMSLIYILKSKFFVSWYDMDRQEHFWNHWEKYSGSLGEIPAHGIFLEKCTTIYYWFPILLLITTLFYIYSAVKKLKVSFPILKLLGVILFSLFYLLINHINDPKTPFIHYSQVNYIGLMIPLGIAITFDMLPRIKNQKVLFIGLVLIISSRLLIISSTHNIFEERHEWMNQVFSEKSNAKRIIKSKNAPKKKLIQIWSVPEESILLSALEGPDEAKTITVVTSVKKYKQLLNSTDTIIRFYSNFNQEELNKHYFNLPKEKYLDDE